MTTVDGKAVKKTEDQYAQADVANEYNCICACERVKQIWDKLVVTYEGTSEVKETKINMFVHQYDLFKMQLDESIKRDVHSIYGYNQKPEVIWQGLYQRGDG